MGLDWSGNMEPCPTVSCDSTVFTIGNEGNSVTLRCIPPGQNYARNVQLYEWRTINSKVIVNKKGKYHVDVNTGILKIFNVRFDDSARLFCSAVLPSEERVTFTHHLIGGCHNLS